MNELYEPKSALFGVLVAQPIRPSTASTGARAPRARFSEVAVAVFAVALPPFLWWMVAA